MLDVLEEQNTSDVLYVSGANSKRQKNENFSQKYPPLYKKNFFIFLFIKAFSRGGGGGPLPFQTRVTEREKKEQFFKKF